MKNLITICSITLLINALFTLPAFGWGKNGHRTIGLIAQNHLNLRAKHGIRKLLGGDSLARVANWADEIKSDPTWNRAGSWHYVNFVNDESYLKSTINPKGDVVRAVLALEDILRNSKSSKEQKAIALKFVVHFVGDLHQPLHAGRKADRGGNDILVEWFGEEAKLHAVWDEKIINYMRLSYSEYADFLDYFSKDRLKQLRKGNAVDWVTESQLAAVKVYAHEGTELSYQYIYKFQELMEKRLSAAGIRLSYLLNNIFSKRKLSKKDKEIRKKLSGYENVFKI